MANPKYKIAKHLIKMLVIIINHFINQCDGLKRNFNVLEYAQSLIIIYIQILIVVHQRNFVLMKLEIKEEVYH